MQSDPHSRSYSSSSVTSQDGPHAPERQREESPLSPPTSAPKRNVEERPNRSHERTGGEKSSGYERRSERHFSKRSGQERGFSNERHANAERQTGANGGFGERASGDRGSATGDLAGSNGDMGLRLASDVPVTKIAELQRMNIEQLQQAIRRIGVRLPGSLTKSQMVFECVKALCERPHEVLICEGVLEVLPDGFGFLRSPNYNYFPSAEDIYVSPAQIRRFDLKKGDTVSGTIRSPKEKEKYFALHHVDKINTRIPAEVKDRILFENLTPCYPNERLVMETTREMLSTRVIDLVAPIGKGQRGIIVAPPRSGKTVVLQNIAHAIATNNPEVVLMVLLIDERPEEVTDMMRNVRGEVIASTFDEPPERHVQVSDMVSEKARRLVEAGNHVVILLDSLTRLARAYNTVQPHSGKILSGGIDANALHKPKRFFGAARNIHQGGSLTIIASALIDTGSRMDEVIFEEFKGTGNMELVLDRRLADRRLWPAIDLLKSGTRREEHLYHPSEYEKIMTLRQATADLSNQDAMNLLTGRLKKSANNIEFLLSLKD